MQISSTHNQCIIIGQFKYFSLNLYSRNYDTANIQKFTVNLSLQKSLILVITSNVFTSLVITFNLANQLHISQSYGFSLPRIKFIYLYESLSMQSNIIIHLFKKLLYYFSSVNLAILRKYFLIGLVDAQSAYKPKRQEC